MNAAASPGPRIARRQWLEAGAIGFVATALAACAERQATAQLTVTPLTPSTSGLVHLDLNENPFGPSPRAIEAIRASLGQLARYTGTEAASLRKQIAAAEGVAADQVVLGDVLDAIAVHLALEGGPGGEFVYSSPGYSAFADAAQLAGGKSIAVPLDARLENDWRALGAAVGPRTRALFVVNPHNPSGTVSDPAVMKNALRSASSGVFVLVDEAYIEYTDDAGARSCADLVREGHNVAVFRTFSKIHGLAGLPFGYALVPSVLAARLSQAGIGNPHALDRLAVAAASESLRDAAFLRTVRQRIADERAQWFALLRALHVRFADSCANFVFFETGRPHAEFAEAMRAGGVEIARTFLPLDSWARITIGLPEENARAREAVRRILG
ncbi:MAG: histidinol-phosphate transaminase [Polyangiaceae bacterium]